MTSISNITITDYSEKSFVVRGDTETHKDDLKGLGGKWNARLRDGSGWIFPSTKKEEVKKWQRTGVCAFRGSTNSFYQNNSQKQYTDSSSSYDTSVLYSEIKKMSSKIDRLEKLILTLINEHSEEQYDKDEILILANSSDEEEDEEKVPRKRLLGGR